MEIIRNQQVKFKEQFGREMGPDDKIFFDAPPVEQLEHQLVQAMRKAGAHPALIYATEQTGRIVTEANQHLLTKAERKEWNDCVTRYCREHDIELPGG